MPNSASNAGNNPPAASWLARLRESCRAWLKSNAEAHAHAKPHSCCSTPPPGAGSQTATHRDKG